MSTKTQVAKLLEDSSEQFVSGSAIAENLGLTRAAVWKCIKQMEDEGYQIEATKRGYRLGPGSDVLSENSVRKHLGDLADSYLIEVLGSVDSTNNYLKRKAPELLAECAGQAWAGTSGAVPWYAVIAGSQSAGRGRLGRSFASPSGSGVYLSVLLKPELPAAQAVRITTASAVAACLAIEECTAEKPQIKWVNDVFVRGKKACGILTEASIDLESGGLDWAVMGIGFNVYEPDGGFPEELKNIAGPIASKRSRDLRSRIAAAFLRHFRGICSELESPKFAEEYRKRSFLTGQHINVIRGGSTRPALALDIDDECHLIVRYEDGTEEALSSGEVSVRAAAPGANRDSLE